MDPPSEPTPETSETPQPTPTTLPAQSVMTKKRYQELAESFREITGSEALTARCMEELRRVMKFDPEQKRYTPEMGKKIVERRKKKAEAEGTTVYKACGFQQYYEKHKEEITNKP